MYFAVAIRGAVAVQRTSAVRETGASRIQSCDRGRAGTGASSNDCDGGSNYADPIKSRKLWHWLSSWLLGRAGRRSLPAALLLALALPAALLPFAGPAAAQEVVEVPRGWSLTPSGISTGGKFRLLFATSGTRDARSSNIAHYNSFVQGRAAVGQSEIRPFSAKFKVVGSTASVDARDNTATTYTNDDRGEQIWWLSGGKVADDYGDFYDGSWDTKNFSAGRNESGNQFPGNQQIFTGSDSDGTASGTPLGNGVTPHRVTTFEMQNAGTLQSSSTGRIASHSFLGLSPVFKVSDSVKGFSVSISSSPHYADGGYRAGETIRVQVDFGEAVTVTGSPNLVLDVGGQARRAAYESGSGTRHLVFAYRVARGETDADGVSLCSDTMKDAGCGQITLNGGSIVGESDSIAVGRDLPDLGNQSGHKVDGVAEAKEVSISSSPHYADGGYRAGETIRVQVDFGEAVTVTGSPNLVLDVGGQARRAAYESGSGTRHLVFAYRVARGETDADGVSLCSDTMKDAGCGQVTLNGGSIVGESDSIAVGRDLPDLGNQSGHKVDGVVADAKDVSITSTPANATPGYAAGETIQVRVDFGEAMTVTGAPYLVLDIAGVARTAVYDSGAGTRYLNFEYTVRAGDFDSNGISLCSSRLIDMGCGRITLDGASISAQSDGVAVGLDLPELGNQSGHKVDGQPNFTPNPSVGPMANPGMGEVPLDWALKPASISREQPFRLLFVSSTKRNATSAAIADYNQHVIDAAGAGHSAIRAFKDGFRAIASTEAVDARDNAGLTGTGVPIYWLNSNTRVADNNADLLDGTWDSESATSETGSVTSSFHKSSIWTGSNDDGTEKTLDGHSLALGGAGRDGGGSVITGGLSTSQATPLSNTRVNARTVDKPLYGLSQLLMVPPPKFASAAFVSTPRNRRFYRLGETIAVEWTFTEPVTVGGAPTLVLTMQGTNATPGAGVRSMRYISGSGTATLRFEYTVQLGDFTSNDINPLGILAAAGASPFTLDGAAIRAVSDNAEADHVPSADTDFLETSDTSHKVETRPVPVTRASISSSPASGTSYGAGETVTVSLAMREAVRVTGRPYIWLDVGGAQRRANYAGPIGESTAVLEFSYTVQAGDLDGDGVALCASGPGCDAIATERRLDPRRGGRARRQSRAAGAQWRRAGTRWMRRNHCPCSRRRARRRSMFRPTGC